MEVGIDFGTTYSSVAVSCDGVSGCVSIAGSVFVPTIVFIPSKGESYYIGNLAVSNAMEKEGTLYINLKRWVGAAHWDLSEFKRKIKNSYPVECVAGVDVAIGGLSRNERVIRPVVSLIYLFLKALIGEVESSTGSVVAGLVCTVPADYNSLKRSFLSVAIEKLNRNIRALINEPTAAALYSLAVTPVEGEVFGVFDFGGGTFDVSLLYRIGNVLAVVGSLGDNNLGGRDVDKAIAERLLEQLPQGLSADDLATATQTIKEDVVGSTGKERHTILVKGEVHVIRFSRSDLEEIARPFVIRAVELFESLLSDMQYPECSVILAGGSSALPGVESTVSKCRGVKRVLFSGSDFRVAVALGAKVYSDILSGRSELKLLDSLTHALSDELSYLEPVVVFNKGCSIPCKREMQFTVSGYRTPYGMFEGEKNRSWLNSVTFKAIHNRKSPTKKSDVVVYELSLDGKLSISVDGTPLINSLLPSPPGPEYERMVYMDGSEDANDRFLGSYINNFNSIHKTHLVETTLLSNLSRSPLMLLAESADYKLE